MPSSKPTLLIVDDEADIRTTSRMILEKDFAVGEADSGKEALKKITKQPVDIVICDIKMAEMDGLVLLEKIKALSPATEVIMQTAVADTKTTVKAVKLGAYDYLIKPAEPDQLLNICRRAYEKKELLIKNQTMATQLAETQVGKMLGKSKVMQDVFGKIKKIADSEVSVLITGETGTGKELVARAIHDEGKRKTKPFIAINCGGIPAELLESDLFGHERGSFTSADNRKLGKFELANGGTIFLDEIGNMPVLMQAKLLRVLQERMIERVGGTDPIPLDVRIISATNEDLAKNINEGKFRSDLYHRLNVVPLPLPPLRERGEDILLLANYFLEKYNNRYNGTFTSIDESAARMLRAYSWPGNIREMEHLFQRITTLEEGPTVLATHLPIDFYTPESTGRGEYTGGGLAEIVGDFEKKLIVQALQDNKHNIQRVADHFKMHRTTLASKMQSHGIKLQRS
jgi:two-component system response regulator AtoC